jgi:hypothetical protein
MACVIIDALKEAGDTLIVPSDLRIQQVPAEQFENLKLQLAGR